MNKLADKPTSRPTGGPDYCMTHFCEMLDSLNKAVEEAGGTTISFERLRQMSALELFTLLATNNVRFNYKEDR